MLRVGEELLGGRVLHEVSGIHDEDPVGHLRHDAHVVRDEHDGRAKLRAHLVDELQDLGLDGHVEGRGGLVADEQRRLAGKRHGDHDALAHATRQLEGIGLEDLLGSGDAYELDHLEGARIRFGLAHLGVVHEDALANLMTRGHDRVKRGHGLLEDHRDLVAAVVAQLVARELGEVRPVELDGPRHDLCGGLRDEAHDGEGHHGLAATRLPHHGKGLPSAHLEGEVLDGG